jgi:tellurite resistance protein TerC
MLEVSTTAWLGTLAFIGALLAWDVGVSARRPHAVGFREAVVWSIFYIAVAVAFGVVFGLTAGWEFGGQYFAGYVVEKSLSIDNLFVFVIIMETFSVPAEHQQRVLTIGIALALVLRAVFIAVGAALLAAASVMLLVFGVLLVGTGIQLFRHRDQDPSVDDNPLVRAARRVLPLGERYEGGRFVTYESGRRVFTPLVLVLVAIGGTDVLFALDSIPAVFGVTRATYIVFAANAFALLGLRALFFLVSGLLDRLVYLSVALSGILVFIGAKLVLHYLHERSPSVPEISTGLSLAVVGALLACATVASVLKARRDPTARARAGSLRDRERSRPTAS